MKNRVLRLALVVVLVMAMVLTMAACGDDTKPSPTPTPTPSTTPATPTPTPSTDPSAPIVTGDEAKLAEYGIEFKAEDKTYDDGKAIDFKVSYDELNKFYDAYREFGTIKVKVVGTSFEGKKITSSTIVIDAATDLTKNNNAGNFTATEAGTYEVTYTISIDIDKNEKIGLFVYGELEEEYEVTKTYTIAKKAVELTSDSDAYVVAKDKIFHPSEIKGSASLPKDYTAYVDIIVADGTEVGEFKLPVVVTTGTGTKKEVVDPTTIVDANYTFTAKEGTRYILSKTDEAKGDAVVQLYIKGGIIDTNTSAEYLNEFISAYNALTDGQKAYFNIQINEYITEYNTNNPSATIAYVSAKVFEFNLSREELRVEFRNLANAYEAAAEGNSKDAAKKALIEFVLNLDTEDENDAETSDLVFVATDAKNNSAAAGALAAYDKYVKLTTDNEIDDTVDTAIVNAYANGFYDTLKTAIGDLQTKYDAIAAKAGDTSTPGTLDDTDFNELKTLLKDVEDAEAKLLPFQKAGDIVLNSNTLAYNIGVAVAQKSLDTFEAYVAVIEAYDFTSYMTNDAEHKVDASYDFVKKLLGYDFKYTSGFGMSFVNNSLVQILTAVPSLYRDAAIKAYTDSLEVAFNLQKVVDAEKDAIITYILGTYGAEAYNEVVKVGGIITTINAAVDATLMAKMSNFTSAGIEKYGFDELVVKHFTGKSAAFADVRKTEIDAKLDSKAAVTVGTNTIAKAAGTIYKVVYEGTVAGSPVAETELTTSTVTLSSVGDTVTYKVMLGDKVFHTITVNYTT